MTEDEEEDKEFQSRQSRNKARERSGTDRLQGWRVRERAATWELVSARGCEIFFGAQDDKKGIGNRTERAAAGRRGLGCSRWWSDMGEVERALGHEEFLARRGEQGTTGG